MSKQSEARANLLAKAEAFVKANEDGNGLLSAEDQAIFDSMLAAANTLEAGGLRTQSQLDRNPPTIKGTGRGVQLVDSHGRVCRALGSKESYAEVVRENPELFGVSQDQIKYCEDGLTIGGYLRAMVAGPLNAAERWAISESNATGAGYTVPSLLAATIIDRFRTRLVVGRAGALTLPLTAAEVSYARLTGDPTGTWRQETTEITESAPTFGRLTFYPKSLACLVKATRELLQDSPNIGDMIERSISAVMAIEVDRVALRGTGAAAEPGGLYEWSGLNEITGVGALTDYSDFIDGHKLMMDDNAPDATAAIISNREWATMNKLEDSTGQPLQLPPAISGLPFLATSAIPTNLGGGSNESFSIMGHFPDLVLGMRQELTIEMLRELYAGTHHYGFVAHLRMDTGVFHEESFVRLLGITP
jgi:HK97 family phage major capsid protein